MTPNATPNKSNSESPSERERPQAVTNLRATTSARDSTTIVSAASDYYLDAELRVIGAIVAVVDTSQGKPRRRIFLTLAAAEKAVFRARMNGHRASVVLCKLIPVNGGEAL
jgi:hypothetical protein